MNDTVIRVENLSKRYEIGHAQPRSGDGLRHVLQATLTAPLRWFRARTADARAAESLTPTNPRAHEFFALRDVSFEVKRGEVLGIIGRNGAGKSTLLKILSRITEPTSGRIGLKGRVASLLEVGTGFHPELTGRENIYLNGAILGMTRAEVKRKFDEIVDFSGVETFLDTPVKRYSSGMYVRLAFAVAAHLESEILVVDEVLAVGDAEFQQKCLGKMSEVARDGRTVLFVSHNIAAVINLTTNGLVFDAGKLIFVGSSAAAVESYSRTGQAGAPNPVASRGEHSAICEVKLLDEFGQSTSTYQPGQTLRLEIVLRTDGAPGLSLELFLFDSNRYKLGIASIYQFHGQTLPRSPGEYRVAIALEPIWLASGRYSFDISTSVANSQWDHYLNEILAFDVVYSDPGGRSWDFKQSMGFGALALRSSASSFERL